MTGRIRAVLVALAFLGLVMVSQSTASADNIQLTLTSVGSATFPPDPAYGVYVDPYVGTLSDNGVSVQNLAVICDDFADDTYVSEQWSATPTTFDGTAASLSNTRMAQLTGLTGSNLINAYSAVAYLAEELLQDTGSGTDATNNRTLLSFAIWAVFDPYDGLGNNPQRVGVYTWLDTYAPGYSTTIQGIVTDAESTAHLQQGLSDLYNISIYSPVGTPDGYSGPPQEFLVDNSGNSTGWGGTSPEGSSLAFLAFELCVLFGGLFAVRKRIRAS